MAQLSFRWAQEDREDGHTTGVLVFSGMNGNPLWCGGSLFNHVPVSSQARLVKQKRTVFASEVDLVSCSFIRQAGAKADPNLRSRNSRSFSAGQVLMADPFAAVSGSPGRERRLS